MRRLLGGKIVKVALGGNHTIALTDTGIMYVWGSDRFGQLDLGDTKKNNNDQHTVLQPTSLESLRKLTVVLIAAGDAHSLCADDNGDVYSWGIIIIIVNIITIIIR